MVAQTLDVATTALSAGIVVIIGSMPVLGGYLIKLGQRLLTLERETPAAFAVVNGSLATITTNVETLRAENDKCHNDLASSVNDIKLTLAEMKGRSSTRHSDTSNGA